MFNILRSSSEFLFKQTYLSRRVTYSNNTSHLVRRDSSQTTHTFSKFYILNILQQKFLLSFFSLLMQPLFLLCVYILTHLLFYLLKTGINTVSFITRFWWLLRIREKKNKRVMEYLPGEETWRLRLFVITSPSLECM